MRKILRAPFLWLVSLRVLSARTSHLLKFDLMRLRARIIHNRSHNVSPGSNKLHIGAGSRKIEGWLNVDVIDSDYDVDFTCGHLPWAGMSFESIVGQHVVEHMEIENELIPFLKELRRICKEGAEIWLSCPDMGKICRSYIDNKGQGMLEDKKSRYPEYTLGDIPSQNIINDIFHQHGEHKNLLDFELAEWVLNQSGFYDCKKFEETDFIKRFPEFPSRNDDYQSLYIMAVAK